MQNKSPFQIYIFKTGEYKGDSLEEVAIKDYPYFTKIKKLWEEEISNIQEYNSKYKRLPVNIKNKKIALEKRLNRMKEIIFALDNFESKIKCSYCNKQAQLASIIEYWNWNKFKEKNELIDISLSNEFVYCSKECAYKDQNAVALHEGKARLYKMEYSKIFKYFNKERCLKWVLEELHDFLYRMLADDLEKTKENLYNLINDVLNKKNENNQQSRQLLLF